jgi:predicted dehydrogenase
MNLPPAWNPPPVTDPIRIGQVGLKGLIAPQHVAELQSNPNFRLVGAFDRRVGEPELALQVEKITGHDNRGGRVYSDYQQFLADPQIEAVCIAAPHHLHRAMALAAFAAGKHVLVEKPMAVHPDDCQAMVQAAQTAGKIAAVQMQHVGRTSMLALRDRLRAGALGKIRQVKVASLWSRDDKYYGRSAWAGRKMIGDAWNLDGVLFNQACHHIAQALILVSSDDLPFPAALDVIQAGLYRFHDVPTLEMEDTAFITARVISADAPRITIAATTCHGADQANIEILGENGRATWDGIGRLMIQNRPEEDFVDDSIMFEGSSRVFNSFAAAIRTGARPITDFSAMATVTEAIFNCYQKAGWKIKKVPWSKASSLPEVIGRTLETGAISDF